MKINDYYGFNRPLDRNLLDEAINKLINCSPDDEFEINQTIHIIIDFLSCKGLINEYVIRIYASKNVTYDTFETIVINVINNLSAYDIDSSINNLSLLIYTIDYKHSFKLIDKLFKVAFYKRKLAKRVFTNEKILSFMCMYMDKDKVRTYRFTLINSLICYCDYFTGIIQHYDYAINSKQHTEFKHGFEYNLLLEELNEIVKIIATRETDLIRVFSLFSNTACNNSVVFKLFLPYFITNYSIINEILNGILNGDNEIIFDINQAKIIYNKIKAKDELYKDLISSLRSPKRFLNFISVFAFSLNKHQQFRYLEYIKKNYQNVDLDSIIENTDWLPKFKKTLDSLCTIKQLQDYN